MKSLLTFAFIALAVPSLGSAAELDCINTLNRIGVSGEIETKCDQLKPSQQTLRCAFTMSNKFGFSGDDSFDVCLVNTTVDFQTCVYLAVEGNEMTAKGAATYCNQ